MSGYEYGQPVRVLEFEGHVGGKSCDGRQIQVRKADGSAVWIPSEHVERIPGAQVIPLNIKPLADDRPRAEPGDAA